MSSNKDQPNVDIAQESGFINFYRTLPSCVGASVRIFDRGDYYSVHEEGAIIAANALYNTTSTIKKLGSGDKKIDTIYLNRQNFETFVRHLLLVKQYRVSVYKQQTSNKNDWAEEYKASPGNWGQLEDVLFGGNCDQVSNSGIMAIKVLTEGTHKVVGVGFVDIAGRIIQLSQFTDNESFTNLEAVLVQLAPKECLLSAGDSKTKLGECIMQSSILVTERKKSDFTTTNTALDLSRLVRGWRKNPAALASRAELQHEQALAAVNSLITYLELTGNESNFNQFKCELYELNQFMRLDAAALKALHVESNNTSTASQLNTTVLSVLDKCRTSLGHRMMAQWVRQPLVDVKKIEERHDLVAAFVSDVELRNTVADSYLKRVPDLSRITRRLARKQATLQDCHRLYQCAELLPDLCNAIASYEGEYSHTLSAAFTTPLQESKNDLSKFQEMVEATVDLEQAKTGHYVIKPDFDDELLELRHNLDSAVQEIEREFKSSAADLGLEAGKTIKLESNSQHGYFYRVTLKEEKVLRNNRSYQTLDTNKAGVRFRSTALTTLNNQHAELLKNYEKQQSGVVAEILCIAGGYIEVIHVLCRTLATLDCICGLASAAVSSSIPYVRPIMAPYGGTIDLKQCRHPCLELQDGISYIPNDCCLGGDGGKLHLITGPNMGGKSTHLRAVATAVLMAQIGSFVPCAEANISVVDAIFTRVGAGDCQRKGVSTFMAEMLETATILKTATPNSLIIVDELGRGTSTYDGFGLAWAISEHIATNIKSSCLFATHFHELTALADTVSSVRNFHVAAATSDNTLTLLYQVLPGPCDRSFGIHCAKIAHFPSDVVEYAKRKADELEDDFGDGDDSEEAVNQRRKQKKLGEDMILECLQKLSSLKEASDEELSSAVETARAELLAKGNPYIAHIIATA